MGNRGLWLPYRPFSSTHRNHNTPSAPRSTINSLHLPPPSLLTYTTTTDIIPYSFFTESGTSDTLRMTSTRRNPTAMATNMQSPAPTRTYCAAISCTKEFYIFGVRSGTSFEPLSSKEVMEIHKDFQRTALTDLRLHQRNNHGGDKIPLVCDKKEKTLDIETHGAKRLKMEANLSKDSEDEKSDELTVTEMEDNEAMEVAILSNSNSSSSSSSSSSSPLSSPSLLSLSASSSSNATTQSSVTPSTEPLEGALEFDIRKVEKERFEVFTQSSRQVFQGLEDAIKAKQHSHMSDNGNLNLPNVNFVSNWEKLNDWINNFGGHFIPLSFFTASVHTPIVLNPPNAVTMSLPINRSPTRTQNTGYSIEHLLNSCFNSELNVQSGATVANESVANCLFEIMEDTCRTLLAKQYRLCTTALHATDLYLHAIYATQIARRNYRVINGVSIHPENDTHTKFVFFPRSFIAQAFNCAGSSWASGAVTDYTTLQCDPSVLIGTEDQKNDQKQCNIELQSLQELQETINFITDQEDDPVFGIDSVIVVIEPALLVGPGRIYRTQFLLQVQTIVRRATRKGIRTVYLLADETLSCIRTGSFTYSQIVKSTDAFGTELTFTPDLVILGKSLGGINLLCVSDFMNSGNLNIHNTMQNAFTSTAPAAMLAHATLILRFVWNTPEFFKRIKEQGRELHSIIESKFDNKPGSVRSLGLALFLENPEKYMIRLGDGGRLLPRLDQTAKAFDQLIKAQDLVNNTFRIASDGLKNRLRLCTGCGICCGTIPANTVNNPELTRICEDCPRVWHIDCWQKQRRNSSWKCPCSQPSVANRRLSSRKRK